MSAIERYLAPASLADALDALSGGNATVLAGGTDLMPQTGSGRTRLRPILLNIRRVPELMGHSIAGGWVRLGALTTINQLREVAGLAEALPLLAEAADHFASDQVRNMGTIGGNICNASPAGDTLVPLLVLDAEVELASKAGTRRIPIAAFFTGPGRTLRAADELLTAVLLPVPRPGTQSRFVKFGTRPALDISAVSVGFKAEVADGVLSNVRLAFGAVGPTPFRGRAAEALLEGRRLDAALIDQAAATAVSEVNPIDDVRATAWYRRELVHNLVRKVLTDVADH
ncbi:MAG: xanthine dehydrogenase family protein subunit M [Magnetospirillum sp.]|nr:xanthine dehydrogenase family protein subunit M [Magnetospirillum sp.]